MSDDRLSIMYPETPAVTPAEPADTPTAGETPAALEPDNHGYQSEDVAENPYSLQEDRVAALGYQHSERVEIPSDVDWGLIAPTHEDQQLVSNHIAFAAHAVGASQADIASLVDTCNQQIVTGEQYQEAEVMADLYQTYGSDLQTKLSQAQQLVASMPDIRDWLDSSGAGNNPAVIKQIISLSGSDRAQYRLSRLTKNSGEQK